MDRDRFPVVVHLLVVREGRLLMLRRANTGFMDGWYALPGGHQDQGESVSAAIRRECREELGAQPEDLKPVCVLPYRSGRHQGINLVFECSRLDAEPCINEPVFDQLVWAQPGSLPEPYAEWIDTALALRAQGGWYQELEWD